MRRGSRTFRQIDVSDLQYRHEWLVGAAGFEPTTTRTPSEYATGLRYAPTYALCDHCPLAGHGKAIGKERLLNVNVNQ
jgi:hypothetical protein